MNRSEAFLAYLRHLGIQPERPGWNDLCRLVRQHLERIPYETFSKFHYFRKSGPFVPALGEFASSLEKGWGGNCYTLNFNFARLLRFLHFRVELVRVVPLHVGLIVWEDGTPFYVDVGYGAPLFQPLPLVDRACYSAYAEEIIIERVQDAIFRIDRRNGGKTFVSKQIVIKPAEFEEFEEDIRQVYRDSDDNPLMRRLTAVKFDERTCWFLRDNVLKCFSKEGEREIVFTRKKDWLQTVTGIFRLDPALAEEALDALERRGVVLFGKY